MEGSPTSEDTHQRLVQTSKLPGLNRMVESMNTSIEMKGLQKTTAELLNKLRCTVISAYETQETENILQTKPTIVIATHSHRWEPIPLIASLPPRNDLSILASAGFAKWGPAFAHIIHPLFVSHHSARGLVARLLEKTDFDRGNLSKEQTDDRNMASITAAAEKVDQGGQVTMFPDVPGQDFWRPGIGRLINKVSNTNDAYIVMATVDSPRLHVREDPHANLSLCSIQVSYRKPIRVADFFEQSQLANHDPKEVTKVLEGIYNEPVAKR